MIKNMMSAVLLVMCSCAIMAQENAVPVLKNKVAKVCAGLRFPEGPAWDGKGHLIVSNCQADYITRVSLDGKIDQKWMTASAGDQPFTWKGTNGMTYGRDGSFYVCDNKRKAIVEVSPKLQCKAYALSCDDHPLNGPNDLAFDAHGNLYFTDPEGSDLQHPIGQICRIDRKTHKTIKVAGGLAYCNGLAFSGDGKYLFVCESKPNRILRYTVKADGSLGEREIFCDLAPVGSGEPDGLAVDTKGNLWIAHYGQHHLVVVNLHGKITGLLPLPIERDGGPTNIEFAGKDLRTVYITDPGTGSLWMFHADTPGLRLFYAP